MHCRRHRMQIGGFNAAGSCQRRQAQRKAEELSQVCSSIDIMAAADGYAYLSGADRKGMQVTGMSGDEPAGCRSAATGCPVLL